MDILLAMGVGQMITDHYQRNLRVDPRFAALDDRLLDDIGADTTSRWTKGKKQNWLDALLAVISGPVAGAVRPTLA